MQKISMVLLAFIALTSLVYVTSCSTEEDVSKQNVKSADINVNAFKDYGKGLDELSSHFAKTRSIILNASESENDNTIDQQGELAIQALLPITNALLLELQISDQDFEKAITELSSEGEDITNLQIDGLKCYAALALYEAYLLDNQPKTRADAMDYTSCIVLGAGYRELANLTTSGIAKFLAKKAIGRAVPLIGWGWAIISATECIRKLQ